MTLTLARGAEKKPEANILLDEQTCSIAVGEELGRLCLPEGEILVDTPLVAAVAVEQSGLFARFRDWIVPYYRAVVLIPCPVDQLEEACDRTRTSTDKISCEYLIGILVPPIRSSRSCCRLVVPAPALILAT